MSVLLATGVVYATTTSATHATHARARTLMTSEPYGLIRSSWWREW